MTWVALLVLPALGGFGLPMLSSELIAGTPAASQGGLLYSVDSTGDGGNVGSSNFCDDGTDHCTLRAAIEASNLHFGADGIDIGLPAGSVINLTQALPDLSESVSISGPGAGQLTVRRSGGGDYRIFNVTTTGTVAFSGLTINNGLPGSGTFSGGGVQNASGGTVNVTNCTLNGNLALIGGGVNNNSSGFVNVTNSTISGNSAGDVGGGIANLGTGTVNITNSIIDDNDTGSNRNGGGLSNRGGGIVNVIGSTVSRNSAGTGGGIENSDGTVNVTNCTISGNSASQTGVGGGGILNFSGTVNVTNSTISNNSAPDVGGIRNNGGTVAVKSSIIALNSGGAPDVSGPFASGGFNLIGKTDGSTGFTQATDQTGTVALPLDPKLDSNGLQDNGGPTQTIALLPGSPALDKGTSNGLTGHLTTDQRGAGFVRTFDDPATPNATGGDGTDIGAFELQTAPAVLGNISTRLRVETGDNVLIGGFIITGTQPKRVIVRAIGPSLPLAGALADPVLELRDSSGGLIASNDNWRSDQEAEIIATTIPPSNDLESAIVAPLPANSSAYTAIVRGVNNGTGIGVVEAYDLDQTVDSRLANISTRGFVQTGDNVLIGGLIVLGQSSLRVIVRAIGPSLPVPGALGDPTLELHDGNGTLIAANNNWRSDQEAEIIATTIPPSNDLESAIVRNFVPGNYTAIVRGVSNTTGVALVEAYGLN